MLIASSVIAHALLGASFAHAPTVEQQLIISCYRVDHLSVVRLVRAGADVNGRYGEGDVDHLRDLWTLGAPRNASEWTPLLALMNASPFPDPPRAVKNTIDDLKWAQNARSKIPDALIRQRAQSASAILYVLLSHNADVDHSSSDGTTVLHHAIVNRKESIALDILEFTRAVNTKSRSGLDGAADVTPLHDAAWSRPLTAQLLARGALVDVVDTRGRSPLDYALRVGNLPVIRLYEQKAKASH